ncbi:MAG: prepilin peptidase [Thermaurantiacus sp.]
MATRRPSFCVGILLETVVLITALLAAAAVLLVIAAVHDVVSRMVPDYTAFGIALAGAAIHLLSGGILWHLAVAAIVLGVGLLLFWLRVMGGGDVKLLAAVALLLPPADVPLAIAAIAIAGGVLALAFLALRPQFRGRKVVPAGRAASLYRRALAAEAWRIRRGGPLPYAVAIAAGTLFTMLSSGGMVFSG